MSNQTYDDYIGVDIDNYEVCFGLYHGRGHWDFWQDTGFEFVVDEEVEFVFQEAINEEGLTVVIDKELIQKAEDMAYELYWERYNENYYEYA